MTSTVFRKRIEVLVDQPLVPRVVKRCEAAGIAAHTILPTLSGAGSGGPWSDDQVSGASAKVMFMTVTSEDKAQRFIDSLAPLLDDYGLVVTISDVAVIRAAKF